MPRSFHLSQSRSHHRVSRCPRWTNFRTGTIPFRTSRRLRQQRMSRRGCSTWRSMRRRSPAPTPLKSRSSRWRVASVIPACRMSRHHTGCAARVQSAHGATTLHC